MGLCKITTKCQSLCHEYRSSDDNAKNFGPISSGVDISKIDRFKNGTV